ncbi:MAG: enoyl-CoA hydratase/isomerase family protein [Chloroflexota bacterium]
MNYEGLLLEKDNGIATITLNAPEKLNALTEKMRHSLPLAVADVARDDAVRVVIVTGAGRGFCSGADVATMTNRPAATSRQELLRVLLEDITAIFPRLEKPVIAAVNGACAGGGFSLALSCDIRIASEAAKFGASQTARGLIPDGGMTYFLPRLVGMSRALELMFTAELIGAAEAERLGIVSQVVPQGELMRVAKELATKIARQAPISISLIKRMAYRTMLDDLSRHLDLETWAQQICRQTEDHKESVRAFLEKRPQPPFKGR